MIRRAAAVLALAMMLAPTLALACPVCTQAASDRNAKAFNASTALLSFLPLTMIGGSIWWLRRKGFGDGEFIDRDEEQERDADEV